MNQKDGAETLPVLLPLLPLLRGRSPLLCLIPSLAWPGLAATSRTVGHPFLHPGELSRLGFCTARFLALPHVFVLTLLVSFPHWSSFLAF